MEHLEQYCEDLIVESKQVSYELSLRAQRIKAKIQICRGLFALVGVLEILISFIPSITELVGDKTSLVINLFSAVLLIAGSIISVYFENDDPERLKDYSKYVRQNTKDIELVMNNPKLTKEEKDIRLHALCDQARVNIEDVYNHWINIERKLNRQNN